MHNSDQYYKLGMVGEITKGRGETRISHFKSNITDCAIWNLNPGDQGWIGGMENKIGIYFRNYTYLYLKYQTHQFLYPPILGYI